MTLTPEELALHESGPWCRCGHTYRAHEFYDGDEDGCCDGGNYCEVSGCFCKEYRDRDAKPEPPTGPRHPAPPMTPEEEAAHRRWLAALHAVTARMEKRIFEDTFKPTDGLP